jgi:hypothetical protein
MELLDLLLSLVVLRLFFTRKNNSVLSLTHQFNINTPHNNHLILHRVKSVEVVIYAFTIN